MTEHMHDDLRQGRLVLLATGSVAVASVVLILLVLLVWYSRTVS